MPLLKYLQRLKYLHSLIKRKSTGAPNQLSRKLNLSKRATEEYISDMKKLGFPIKYCKKRASYFYEEDVEMPDHFFYKSLDENDQKKITGGGNYRHVYLLINCSNNALLEYNFTLNLCKPILHKQG